MDRQSTVAQDAILQMDGLRNLPSMKKAQFEILPSGTIDKNRVQYTPHLYDLNTTTFQLPIISR